MPIAIPEHVQFATDVLEQISQAKHHRTKKSATAEWCQKKHVPPMGHQNAPHRGNMALLSTKSMFSHLSHQNAAAVSGHRNQNRLRFICVGIGSRWSHVQMISVDEHNVGSRNSLFRRTQS